MLPNAPFRLLESKTVPLTKDFLAEFLKLPPSPTERTRDAKRVAYLRAKYDAGLWGPTQWATARCNGTVYRINGSHSSAMLNALDGHMADGLVVHIDSYDVNSVDDLAMLFRQYDDRKSSRSPADVAGAYQGLEETLCDSPRLPAKLAAEAVTWWRRSVERSPVNKGDDRYMLFHEAALHPFIKWVSNDIFTSGKMPELMKEPIVAAMFMTFEVNEAEARAFWKKVSTGGDEYQETAPDRVLSEWLRAAYQRETPETTGISTGQLYQGCIYAWNAHRRSEAALKTIRHDTKRGWLKPIA